jgi:hypothetical protein
MRGKMYKTEEFIAALHVIAAGEASGKRQNDAVREVFERCLIEVGGAVRGDSKKIRQWVTDLQRQLKAPSSQLSRIGRFELLRDHAQELVADWLRKT